MESVKVRVAQATCKALAAASQTKYALVKYSNTTKLDAELFNESYLVFCSMLP